MMVWTSVIAALALAVSSASSVEEKPKLVVVIGVDQLIPEQLDRLAPYFGDGYGRFVRTGRNYRRAMLEHANTETGPGYATLGTGCHPSKNGIIANGWFNEDGTGSVYCVEDRDASLVVGFGVPASTATGVSPRNFRVQGLGDWMKFVDEESRVVSLAGKDRAAIGMGGQRPDLCVWWNKKVAGFSTSTYYRAELPEWLSEWNADLAGKVFDGEWGRGWSLDLPDGIEGAGTAPDEREGESSRGNVVKALRDGREEADSLKRRELLGYAGYRSPVGDILTLELAELTVDQFELGADEHPDVLFIGLSGCDVIGHAYGPYSVEVTDLLLRIDRELERLFRRLDEKVGKDSWTAVLTADHGVLMLPEEATMRGIGAERAGRSQLSSTFLGLHEKCVEQYGEDFIALESQSGLRLNNALMESAGVESSEVQALLASELRGADWIERVFVRGELESELSQEDPWLRLAQRCYLRERSPDIVIQARPWLLIGMSTGTSHGSPYPYDRSVPLIFMGKDIAPAVRFDAASTADVVPTVLKLLGIEPPDELDGRALSLR